MKKKLIAASMAAAMTLSLAACGGSGASSTASAADTASTAASTEAASGDEQINLRMAWWGSQDRHDKTIAAIELYESLNPNVKIEYEYYSFDDYFTKLKTLVASDQVWDVFQMGGNFPLPTRRSIGTIRCSTVLFLRQKREDLNSSAGTLFLRN